jgi:hypothetical protein
MTGKMISRELGMSGALAARRANDWAAATTNVTPVTAVSSRP